MNKKYAPYLFAAIMSIMMLLVMFLTIIILNTEVGGRFIPGWSKATIIEICAAFATAIVIAPIAKKIVNRLSNNDSKNVIKKTDQNTTN